jgi:predicted aldo/keto reductase-like oxidoreductase
MKTMAGAFWDKERKNPINSGAALKWVLRNENIHTTVPDCGDFDQMNRNIKIMSDIRLTDQEKIDLIPKPGEAESGLYCQQCGECLDQCPYNLDIPAIMRSYMYAFGHHNFAHAKNTLKESGTESDPCRNCLTCSVSCRAGFDIKTKICDIAGLLNIPDDFLA